MEVTAAVLLNGHDVPVKLPSREPCLCPYTAPKSALVRDLPFAGVSGNCGDSELARVLRISDC